MYVNPYAEDPTSAIDALWKASLLLHPRRPGGSGLMQMVQKGKHLPVIDMNPSDLSCVYSTLCYVSSHAKLFISYQEKQFNELPGDTSSLMLH